MTKGADQVMLDRINWTDNARNQTESILTEMAS